LLRECADTFEDSFDNDRDRVALLAATRAIRELEVERRRERQLDSQRLKREFALGHEGISDQFMQLQLEHKQLSKRLQEFEKKRLPISRGSDDGSSVFSDQDGSERQFRSAFSAFAPSRPSDMLRGDEAFSKSSESRRRFRGGDLSCRELKVRSRCAEFEPFVATNVPLDDDTGEEDGRFELDRPMYDGRSKHNHA
jgi:hypothetical protein